MIAGLAVELEALDCVENLLVDGAHVATVDPHSTPGDVDAEPVRELAADAKPRMKAYLDRLAEAGLSRD